MSIDITGRHIEITEPIRKFATDRVDRLRGGIDAVQEVHFILTVEKHQRHIAELNLKTRRDFYHAEEVSTDMYTSIAAAVDKVEKQSLEG
jgi:putative sigma-54 modulation protein